MLLLRPRAAVLGAALMSVSLAFTAVSSAQETRIVQADNGAIAVPVNPQRIVAIGNTSLPFIDMGGVPIGVTTLRDSALALIPADQRAIYDAAVNLGPSGGEVDLERLAALAPDLIFAQMPAGDFEPLRARLEAIAPTVYFGLGTEWTALADGLAIAGNLTATLDAQKAALAAEVTAIQTTYSAIIAGTNFVALDRYASSDPGVFVITNIGCVEIARDNVGLNLPVHEAGNNGQTQTFEQIGDLTAFDVILYPVDATGQPTAPFLPVVETNAWNALPAVTSGRALGVFCPGNNSYGAVLRYLDSLDAALATLPTNG
jgi:iron complex transport system substrate-binding protein